jgi:hypothetical protein
MITATEIMQQEKERIHQERVRRIHREFLDAFAPADPRSRADFEAHLAALLRDAAIEALRPFQDAAAAQIALRPVPPVVLKSDGHG